MKLQGWNTELTYEAWSFSQEGWVIAHEQLSLAAAEEFTEFQEAQGHMVLVVDLKELYHLYKTQQVLITDPGVLLGR